MKIFYLTVLTLIFISLIFCSDAVKRENERIYEELDVAIDESLKYEEIKQKRIDRLKTELHSAKDNISKKNYTDSLIKEYESFNSDSALIYINYNLNNPAVTADRKKYLQLMIKRADILGHAGIFPLALSTMEKIPRAELPQSLLEEYFSAYSSIYQYLCEYTDAHEPNDIYLNFRTLYADSLRQVTDSSSFNYLMFVIPEKARAGNIDYAINQLTEKLKFYKSGTREYAILTSILADIHKNNGARDQFKRYLSLSALSDVKGAVKENVSFRQLATVMFEDGDVDRANKYLKKSIEDANFYSAQMRNAQSALMLPIIDDAYSQKQEILHSHLRGLVISTAILAVILIIALTFVLIQFKKLRKEHIRINNLNDDMKLITEELEEANIKLRENNIIKEQYATLFMEYCSSSIATLEHYQKSLLALSMQPSNRNALIKKIGSTQIADELRKNFYEKFDEAILNIYPEFVNKFNSLLQPQYRIILKNGELLNTELRLFALIRIGIEDSQNISQFLQCSLSTVYTYRSKMKKRALNPDSFEKLVKSLE